MRIRERFNPRAPCGARHVLTASDVVVGIHISTHAPLAGRDVVRIIRDIIHITYFNPRAPCGARLLPVFSAHTVYGISTHAPLAGRDV